MRFFATYFGCRANQAELQEWIIELENAGYQYTVSVAEADFCLLNTCSVTDKAERDVLRFINQSYKRTRQPWFIAGCTVSRDKIYLQQKYSQYIFLDNTEKKDIVRNITGHFAFSSNVIHHSAFKSRMFLKIQDGCNLKCSFCIVPSLRGKSISLPLEEVEARARYYASLGYREITLTGINLSSYGYDLFPSENLLGAINKIHAIAEIEWIRLSSLDTRYLDYHFIRELGRLKKMADSFHFSLQSGSYPVLKRMKRISKISAYRLILNSFHRYFPEANLGADFIVGFPGESEREFRATVQFIKNSRLNYLHIFPFSPRPGTRAAEMEAVPRPVARKRAQELKEIDRQLRLEYRERFLGKKLEGIVIEETSHYTLLVTRNFLNVRVPPVRGFKRKKKWIRIEKILNENLLEGILVEE